MSVNISDLNTKLSVMSDPDQEEMRRKRLARLAAMSGGGGGGGGGGRGGPVLAEKDKTTTNPAAMETETAAVVAGRQTSLEFDSGIETMEVESSQVISPSKRNRTSSSANYESSPEQVLSSLQRVLAVSLAGSESSCLSCPQTSLQELPSLLGPSELAGPLLAEVCAQQSPLVAVNYLVSCATRLGQEETLCGKRSLVPPLSSVLASTRAQVVLRLSQVVRQLQPSWPPHQSPLYSQLTDQSFPPDLLQDLVTLLAPDSAAFSAVFSPLLLHCLTEAQRTRLVSSSLTRPLLSLTRLIESREPGSNSRPVADLLVSLPNWLPDTLTQAGGAEVVSLSFLGPFLAPSVFPEEDPGVAEHYFTGDSITAYQVKSAQGELQPSLEIYRKALHDVFYPLLLAKSSRPSCLAWLTAALTRNSKRQQLQTNERLVAGDGFMLNLVSLLQLLCSKVKQDKVDPAYLYSDTCRVDTADDSRLKSTSQDFKEFQEKQEKGKEANFPTECWWLTLYAHHVGVLPIIRRYQRRLRALRELQKMVEDLEKTEPAWKNHPSAGHNKSMLKKWKQQIKKQSKSKACADIGLLDEQLFSRCLSFYSSVCEHVMRLLDPANPHHPTLPLQPDPPVLFKLLPEWLVDDMADFLLFGLQFMPATVSSQVDLGIVTWLLVSLSHTHHFSNPHMVSRLVEILFVVNPGVQDKTHEMYARIMSHYISQEFLPGSLMTFYTEVEQTGSSNEFYDKFTIRYHISIIIKSMWESSTHKMAIISESHNGKNFIKFINMMMNDTTFLLDESLDALKRIHDVQDDMNDPAKWASQSQEQQTSRARQLSQDERQCRSYLTLARETVDMFHYLTQDIHQPFLRPELADRLAAMLDHVLDQLTNGPKCK